MKSTQAGDASTEPQVIRCYVYAHVARSNPLAIQRQIQDGYALAGSLSGPGAEYQVVRVFQDDGGSGRSANRPAYEEMLAGLERGDAAAVLVFREDRLYRDPDLQKAYSEISNRLGVETYSVESGRLGR
ncbi:recombinase family protein [Actinacidiphila sp. ITFR-21]|uniref:recombinase family protein n=1 Tax=Actinacidiphila sp. ITFR-21 TaxID=3075199 RepID=UPI002889F5AF|nr:recombinase family protein [Streptomyces sp. ITFR-21]WNI16950.1 recombinase family protein [Streptomyces sp. ITFR-21]